ncbi:MAG TPA: tetratricopeptide repeat protein [Methylomirabilota bacterium]
MIVLVALAQLAAALVFPASAPAQLSDADVYVAEAVLAIEDKRWDKALGLLRQALGREPDHVEALYYTGVAYMGMKQPADAVAVLQRARRKSPAETSIAYQLGLAYFALEQYAQAAPILEEVFAREPALESLGYYVGFLRYRAGRYEDALAAFRAGRTADPSIDDLTRLYAGLSLQRLGLSAQAEAELSQIGQLRPASPLTAPAERLKSAISASRDVVRRFRAEVRAGMFYDDNAGAEPDRKSNDPDVRALRQNNRETIGELFSLTLEYDWLRAENWLGSAGFTFVGTHNNTLPSFDIQDYSGVLRLAHSFKPLDRPAQAGITYAYDYLVLDNDEFVQRHAVTTYLAVVAIPRHLTSIQARLEAKEYSEERPLPVEEFQDAVNYLAGVVHFVRFAGDRHFLKAGYQFDYDDARGRNYVYRGHRLLAGAQYTLPWRAIRLTYDFDVHDRDYVHAHSLLPSDARESRERSDREYTHTARVEVPLPWFTREQAFFATAEYVGKVADSNLAAFEYHRNYGAIYFTWQY